MICPYCLKDSPAGYSVCPHCQAGWAEGLRPAYAGIPRRLTALFLDIFIAVVLTAGLFLPLQLLLPSDLAMLPPIVAGAVGFLLGIIQLILLLTSGQTIGKKLVGAKIVKQDLQKATVGTLLMREIIGRFVCGITFNIGYLIALFNPERRGLHDKIAGTIVIKKLSPALADAAPAQYAPPEPAYVAPPPVDYSPAPAATAPVEIPMAMAPAASTPPPFKEAPAPPPLAPVAAPPPFHPSSAVVPPPAPAVGVPPPPAPEQTCPGCHSPIEASDSKFCLVCGFPLKSEVKICSRFCPTCNAPVNNESTFCASCGQRMEKEEPLSAIPISQPAPPGSEATMVVTTPELISYTAEGQQEVFTVQLPVTKIGRLKDNQIPLIGEKAISGHHCEIYTEGGQYFIRDLGSTNGVYVNNRKVDVSPLADGDKIKLGFKIFRFKMS